MLANEILRESYLTTSEAAALLAVHPITVAKWISQGKLESILIAHRRWIPKRVVAERYAELLANTETRIATIERLKAIALAAGVTLEGESFLADAVEQDHTARA